MAAAPLGGGGVNAADQDLGLYLHVPFCQARCSYCAFYTEPLAREAESETKLGRWEDKVHKNLLVTNKTPGPEDLEPVAVAVEVSTVAWVVP